MFLKARHEIGKKSKFSEAPNTAWAMEELLDGSFASCFGRSCMYAKARTLRLREWGLVMWVEKKTIADAHQSLARRVIRRFK
jgi:hypothetical protein